MKKLRPRGAELASSWLPPHPPGLRVPFRRPAGSVCQAGHIRIRHSGVCPATAPPSSGLRASGGGLAQAAALGRRLVPKSCLQIGLSSRGKGSPLLPFLLRVSSCTGPSQGLCRVAFWIQLVPITPCHCPPPPFFSLNTLSLQLLVQLSVCPPLLYGFFQRKEGEMYKVPPMCQTLCGPFDRFNCL